MFVGCGVEENEQCKTNILKLGCSSNYDSQVESEKGRQELKEGSVTVNKKNGLSTSFL